MKYNYESIYEKQFTFDEPINIFGLDLFPVSVDKYYEFNMNCNILKINKNKSPDVKIIKMSYLEYIINEISKDGEESEILSSMFFIIFSLCLNMEEIDIRYYYDNNNKIILSINGNEIKSKEFDIIREIIMCQNIPSYSDEYIDPELEAELKEVARIKRKNTKSCSIEKRIISVSMGLNTSVESIKRMTLRKFLISLEMIDKKMHYIMMKTASMSGMVEFKSPIIHYLMEEEDMGQQVVDYDVVRDKIK